MSLSESSLGQETTPEGHLFTWISSAYQRDARGHRRTREFQVKAGKNVGCFESIQRALDYVAEGDRIIVHPGIYFEQITMNRRVELHGDGGDVIVEHRADATVICKAKTGCCSVRGLTIKNKSTFGTAVAVVEGEASFNDCFIFGVVVQGQEHTPGKAHLRKCTILNAPQCGVAVRGAGSALVDACVIRRNGESSVVISSTGQVEFTGCTINASPLHTLYIQGDVHSGGTDGERSALLSRNSRDFETRRQSGVFDAFGVLSPTPKPTRAPALVSPRGAAADSPPPPRRTAFKKFHVAPKFFSCKIDDSSARRAVVDEKPARLQFSASVSGGGKKSAAAPGEEGKDPARQWGGKGAGVHASRHQVSWQQLENVAAVEVTCGARPLFERTTITCQHGSGVAIRSAAPCFRSSCVISSCGVYGVVVSNPANTATPFCCPQAQPPACTASPSASPASLPGTQEQSPSPCPCCCNPDVDLSPAYPRNGSAPLTSQTAEWLGEDCEGAAASAPAAGDSPAVKRNPSRTALLPKGGKPGLPVGTGAEQDNVVSSESTSERRMGCCACSDCCCQHGPVFEDCRIEDNAKGGVVVASQGAAAHPFSPPAGAVFVYLYKNVIENSGGPGILLVGTGANAVVVGNDVREHQDPVKAPAIAVVDGARGTFRTNQIRQNSKGLLVETGGRPTFFKCHFYSNTIGIEIAHRGLGRFEACTISRCGWNGQYAVVVRAGGDPVFSNQNYFFRNGPSRETCGTASQSMTGTNGRASNEFRFPPLGLLESSKPGGGSILVAQYGKGVFLDNHITEGDSLHAPQVAVREGSHPVFEGNKIMKGSGAGVHCSSESTGVFRRNHFVANTFDNVLVTRGADPLFEENHVSGAGGFGFRIGDGFGTFRKNTVRENTAGGVRLEADSRAVVVANTIQHQLKGVVIATPGGASLVAKNVLTHNAVHIEVVAELSETDLLNSSDPPDAAASVISPTNINLSLPSSPASRLFDTASGLTPSKKLSPHPSTPADSSPGDSARAQRQPESSVRIPGVPAAFYARIPQEYVACIAQAADHASSALATPLVPPALRMGSTFTGAWKGAAIKVSDTIRRSALRLGSEPVVKGVLIVRNTLECPVIDDVTTADLPCGGYGGVCAWLHGSGRGVVVFRQNRFFHGFDARVPTPMVWCGGGVTGFLFERNEFRGSSCGPAVVSAEGSGGLFYDNAFSGSFLAAAVFFESGGNAMVVGNAITNAAAKQLPGIAPPAKPPTGSDTERHKTPERLGDKRVTLVPAAAEDYGGAPLADSVPDRSKRRARTRLAVFSAFLRLKDLSCGVACGDRGAGRVVGNAMKNCGDAGVLLSGSGGNVLVAGNVLTGNRYGVQAVDDGCGVVVRNDVSGNAFAGIAVGRRAPASFAFNAVRNEQVGVLAERGASASFDANEISDCRGCAVKVAAGACITMTGNSVLKAPTGLTFSEEGADGVFSGNTFESLKTAVAISHGANPTLEKNVFGSSSAERDNAVGVVVSEGGRGLLKDNAFKGNEVAVRVESGGDPQCFDNLFEGTPRSRIAVFVGAKGKGFFGKGNNFIHHNGPGSVAVKIDGDLAEPVFDRCSWSYNEVAVSISQGTGTLRGCDLSRCVIAVETCGAGSSGVFEENNLFHNLLASSVRGGSSPEWRANYFVDNDTAMHVSRGACPDVADCVFSGEPFVLAAPTAKQLSILPDVLLSRERESGLKDESTRLLLLLSNAELPYAADSSLSLPLDTGLDTSRPSSPDSSNVRPDSRQGKKPAMRCGVGLVAETTGGGTFEKCVFQKFERAAVVVGTAGDPKLARCEVKEGKVGVVVEAGGKGLFLECTVNHHGIGIGVSGAAARPRVEKCLVSDCGTGVKFSNKAGGCLFRNTIMRHETGVSVLSSSEPEVRGNHVTDNAVGLLLRSKSCPSVLKNVINNNRHYGIHAAQGCALVTYNAIAGNGKLLAAAPAPPLDLDASFPYFAAPKPTRAPILSGGILCEDTDATMVKKNFFADNAAAHIVVCAHANPIIAHNVMHKAPIAILAYSGARGMYTSNVIKNPVERSIAFVLTGEGTMPDVLENLVTGPAIGLLASDRAKGNVERNLWQECTVSGVVLASTSACAVVDNFFFANKAAAVSALPGAEGKVAKNRIVDTPCGVRISDLDPEVAVLAAHCCPLPLNLEPHGRRDVLTAFSENDIVGNEVGVVSRAASCLFFTENTVGCGGVGVLFQERSGTVCLRTTVVDCHSGVVFERDGAGTFEHGVIGLNYEGVRLKAGASHALVVAHNDIAGSDWVGVRVAPGAAGTVGPYNNVFGNGASSKEKDACGVLLDGERPGGDGDASASGSDADAGSRDASGDEAGSSLSADDNPPAKPSAANARRRSTRGGSGYALLDAASPGKPPGEAAKTMVFLEGHVSGQKVGFCVRAAGGVKVMHTAVFKNTEVGVRLCGGTTSAGLAEEAAELAEAKANSRRGSMMSNLAGSPRAGPTSTSEHNAAATRGVRVREASFRRHSTRRTLGGHQSPVSAPAKKQPRPHELGAAGAQNKRLSTFVKTTSTLLKVAGSRRQSMHSAASANPNASLAKAKKLNGSGLALSKPDKSFKSPQNPKPDTRSSLFTNGIDFGKFLDESGVESPAGGKGKARKQSCFGGMDDPKRTSFSPSVEDDDDDSAGSSTSFLLSPASKSQARLGRARSPDPRGKKAHLLPLSPGGRSRRDDASQDSLGLSPASKQPPGGDPTPDSGRALLSPAESAPRLPIRAGVHRRKRLSGDAASGVGSPPSVLSPAESEARAAPPAAVLSPLQMGRRSPPVPTAAKRLKAHTPAPSGDVSPGSGGTRSQAGEQGGGPLLLSLEPKGKRVRGSKSPARKARVGSDDVSAAADDDDDERRRKPSFSLSVDGGDDGGGATFPGPSSPAARSARVNSRDSNVPMSPITPGGRSRAASNASSTEFLQPPATQHAAHEPADSSFVAFQEDPKPDDPGKPPRYAGEGKPGEEAGGGEKAAGSSMYSRRASFAPGIMQASSRRQSEVDETCSVDGSEPAALAPKATVGKLRRRASNQKLGRRRPSGTALRRRSDAGEPSLGLGSHHSFRSALTRKQSLRQHDPGSPRSASAGSPRLRPSQPVDGSSLFTPASGSGMPSSRFRKDAKPNASPAFSPRLGPAKRKSVFALEQPDARRAVGPCVLFEKCDVFDNDGKGVELIDGAAGLLEYVNVVENGRCGVFVGFSPSVAQSGHAQLAPPCKLSMRGCNLYYPSPVGFSSAISVDSQAKLTPNDLSQGQADANIVRNDLRYPGPWHTLHHPLFGGSKAGVHTAATRNTAWDAESKRQQQVLEAMKKAKREAGNLHKHAGDLFARLAGKISEATHDVEAWIALLNLSLEDTKAANLVLKTAALDNDQKHRGTTSKVKLLSLARLSIAHKSPQLQQQQQPQPQSPRLRTQWASFRKKSLGDAGVPSTLRSPPKVLFAGPLSEFVVASLVRTLEASSSISLERMETLTQSDNLREIKDAVFSAAAFVCFIGPNSQDDRLANALAFAVAFRAQKGSPRVIIVTEDLRFLKQQKSGWLHKVSSQLDLLYVPRGATARENFNSDVVKATLSADHLASAKAYWEKAKSIEPAPKTDIPLGAGINGSPTMTRAAFPSLSASAATRQPKERSPGRFFGRTAGASPKGRTLELPQLVVPCGPFDSSSAHPTSPIRDLLRSTTASPFAFESGVELPSKMSPMDVGPAADASPVQNSPVQLKSRRPSGTVVSPQVFVCCGSSEVPNVSSFLRAVVSQNTALTGSFVMWDGLKRGPAYDQFVKQAVGDCPLALWFISETFLKSKQAIIELEKAHTKSKQRRASMYVIDVGHTISSPALQSQVTARQVLLALKNSDMSLYSSINSWADWLDQAAVGEVQKYLSKQLSLQSSRPGSRKGRVGFPITAMIPRTTAPIRSTAARRKKLRDAQEELAGIPVALWTVADVCAWLASLGFPQYDRYCEEAGFGGQALLAADSHAFMGIGIMDLDIIHTILAELDGVRDMQSR